MNENKYTPETSGEDIQRVLKDPAASFWLKKALEDALKRDPVDAANDADTLNLLLAAHAGQSIEIIAIHDWWSLENQERRRNRNENHQQARDAFRRSSIPEESWDDKE